MSETATYRVDLRGRPGHPERSPGNDPRPLFGAPCADLDDLAEFTDVL